MDHVNPAPAAQAPVQMPSAEEIAEMKKCYEMQEQRRAYNRAYMKKYRVDQREKVKVYKLAWYHMNRAKQLAEGQAQAEA